MVPPQHPFQIAPAQLSFLTIYNPSLGDKSKSLAEQIVFYASRPKDNDQEDYGSKVRDVEYVSKEEENEQLRQVGLAQAMVSFAK